MIAVTIATSNSLLRHKQLLLLVFCSTKKVKQLLKCPAQQASSVLAEVWAVRYSFILARELGIHYLIVKLDTMEIVLALNNVSCPNILICGIVHDGRNIDQAFHRCEVKRSYQSIRKPKVC